MHAEKERDELRAEKANWLISSSKSEGQEGTNSEVFVKARDEALAEAKVYYFYCELKQQ